MSYPCKPGDTFTAKVIGTYPELPDYGDTKARDPEWYFEKEFDEKGHQTLYFGGPKGEAVVRLRDGVFTTSRPDGTVLRKARWNHVTGTWDEEEV